MGILNVFKPKKNLSGMKVWLSGAIPEKEAWRNPLTDRDVLEFVAYFSALIFQRGGTIVHGCHPLFTPVLAEQSKRFAGSKAQLQLYVSEMWGKSDFEKYEVHANITEVASFENSKDTDNPQYRNKSLTLLRNEMGSKVDCIVSIGGRVYENSQNNAGIIEEVGIAVSNGLPCYNLGGYGGAASKVKLQKKDNIFLSNQEMKYLMETEELSILPSVVVKYISRDAINISFFNIVRRLLKKVRS